MRNLTLLCATILTIGTLHTNTANAQVQTENPKLHFGFNVGGGMPMGDYKKADTTALPLALFTHNKGMGNDTTKYNGFAKTGIHFDVYAAYMFIPQLGLMVSLGGTINSYDISAFNSQVVALSSEGSNGGSTNSAPTFTTSDEFFIGQYLAGPYISLPLGGDKLKLEVTLLAGIITANYPSLTGTQSQNGYTQSITYNVSNTSAFGYRGSLGIEFKVTDVTGLHFNVGYAGSSLIYKSIESTQSQSYQNQTQSQTFNDNAPKTMSVGLIQATVGISVDL